MSGTLTTDFDGAWKETIELFFRPFMEFCFPDVAADIEWAKGHEFLDKELPAINPHAAAGKMVADTLVKVYRRDGKQGVILLHIEIQCQAGIELGKRMFIYHYRIAEQYGLPVASLAVLADDRVDWRPCRYVQDLWGTRLQFDFEVCKLLDFETRPGLLEPSDNPVAMVIAAHLNTLRTRRDLGERKRLKLGLIKRVFDKGYDREQIGKLFKLVDWLMTLSVELDIEFKRELSECNLENVMPYITSIERVAKEEGRQEGQIKLLEQLLRRRCGILPEVMQTRLRGLNTEQMEKLADALLDFKSLEDLEAWLVRQA